MLHDQYFRLFARYFLTKFTGFIEMCYHFLQKFIQKFIQKFRMNNLQNDILSLSYKIQEITSKQNNTKTYHLGLLRKIKLKSCSSILIACSLCVIGQELDFIVHIIEQGTWVKRISLNSRKIKLILLIFLLESHFLCLIIHCNYNHIVCHKLKCLRK